MSLLTAIFGKMQLVWGAKWTSHLTADSSQSVKEWYAATNDLSDDKIIKAFQEARKLCEFPPSIATFRKLALGILPAEVAFLRAIEGDGEFKRYLGPWYWKESNGIQFRELRSLFLAAYRQEIEESYGIRV